MIIDFQYLNLLLTQDWTTRTERTSIWSDFRAWDTRLIIVPSQVQCAPSFRFEDVFLFGLVLVNRIHRGIVRWIVQAVVANTCERTFGGADPHREDDLSNLQGRSCGRALSSKFNGYFFASPTLF